MSEHFTERAEEIRNELIERGNKMGDTEFRVKAQNLRRLGGFWPNALDDWTTPEGMALSREIQTRRGQ